MITSYCRSASSDGSVFVPTGPKSCSSTLRQKAPQRSMIPFRIPLIEPDQLWSSRTFAPPLNFRIDCQPDVVPSWNAHRYSHVSSRPGSLNCTVKSAGLPSSTGLGVVMTSDTIGATFTTCSCEGGPPAARGAGG